MDSPLSTGFSHLNWSFPTFQGWASLHQLRPTPRLHEGTQPRYRSAIVPSMKLGQAPIFCWEKKKLQKKQQPQKVRKAGKGQLCVLCRDILRPWIFWCNSWFFKAPPLKDPRWCCQRLEYSSNFRFQLWDVFFGSSCDTRYIDIIKKNPFKTNRNESEARTNRS